jgi:hypothetical protein
MSDETKEAKRLLEESIELLKSYIKFSSASPTRILDYAKLVEQDAARLAMAMKTTNQA